MSDVFEYYRRRAGEHEEIYGWKDDKRQEDQGFLEDTRARAVEIEIKMLIGAGSSLSF